jgi:hypothetical protein
MKKNEESYNKEQNKINYRQKMRKNEELQNEIHFAISRKPMLNIGEPNVFVRVGKYMKIFSYLVLFTGISLAFTSCMGGYIASEPAYVDYARPQRQYENQIWIDGDWGWNSQTHVYVQKAGYWDSPRLGHSYIKGSWQTSPRGKSWTKGHWQRDRQQNNGRQRNSRYYNNGR